MCAYLLSVCGVKRPFPDPPPTCKILFLTCSERGIRDCSATILSHFDTFATLSTTTLCQPFFHSFCSFSPSRRNCVHIHHHRSHFDITDKHHCR